MFNLTFPTLPCLTPWSLESLGTLLLADNTAPASAALATANQAYFFPFEIHEQVTAVKMFVMIGATAGVNVDVGIYDEAFNRLVSSGATAMGSINTLQIFDITDTVLPPGQYYMAISNSGTTGTVFLRSAADEIAQSCFPCLEMASAHALPATATPVKSTAGTPITAIVMGINFDGVI